MTIHLRSFTTTQDSKQPFFTGKIDESSSLWIIYLLLSLLNVLFQIKLIFNFGRTCSCGKSESCKNLKIPTRYFCAITILITRTCKTKNITATRYYSIFTVPGEKGKK